MTQRVKRAERRRRQRERSKAHEQWVAVGMFDLKLCIAELAVLPHKCVEKDK